MTRVSISKGYVFDEDEKRKKIHLDICVVTFRHHPLALCLNINLTISYLNISNYPLFS